ncbi:ROK family protein, partial [Solobacterium moorei]|uniref:ROK family protein n=1 Tax=Solobacterium moorei TaxID=102148 RepID=UPI0023F411DE
YLSGQPYYGAGKSAGVMLGGMILQSSTINQPWDGSYESLASTTALIQNAQKFNPCITNGRSLFCHLDDPTIKAVLDAWIEQIAIGLCSLAHVYNVPLFILGGGILEQEYVFNNIKRVFQKYIIPGFDGVQIHQAKLGNRAGIYGALALNLEQSAYYKK